MSSTPIENPLRRLLGPSSGADFLEDVRWLFKFRILFRLGLKILAIIREQNLNFTISKNLEQNLSFTPEVLDTCFLKPLKDQLDQGMDNLRHWLLDTSNHYWEWEQEHHILTIELDLDAHAMSQRRQDFRGHVAAFASLALMGFGAGLGDKNSSVPGNFLDPVYSASTQDTDLLYSNSSPDHRNDAFWLSDVITFSCVERLFRRANNAALNADSQPDTQALHTFMPDRLYARDVRSGREIVRTTLLSNFDSIIGSSTRTLPSQVESIFKEALEKGATRCAALAS